MELNFGGIFCRVPSGFMKAGETLLGHQHNFDHPTFCLNGEIDLSLLKVTKVDVAGMPLDAEVEYTVTLKEDDPEPGHLVLAGRWHTITAKKDGSRYMCVYASRFPQALTMHAPGQMTVLPYSKVDEQGVRWYRDVAGLVTDKTHWPESFR